MSTKTRVQIRLLQSEKDKIDSAVVRLGFESMSHLIRYGAMIAATRKNKDTKLFNATLHDEPRGRKVA